MSSKTKTTATKEDGKPALVPKLRFAAIALIELKPPMKQEMKLIKEIQKPGFEGKVSRVTGNDTSGRHNTTVWVYTDTRELVLKWRKSADTAEVPVGMFRLDLKGLLKAGHCKMEGNGRHKIRFNIYHDDDRWLRVRVKRKDSGGESVAQLAW